MVFSEKWQHQLVGKGNKNDILTVLLCLVAGTLLRLIWPADMEFKTDEIYMFEEAQKVIRGDIPLPLLGMDSGGGFKNPGFSIWVFAFFARFSDDPVVMVQWVQGVNVAVLWVWFFYVLARFHDNERTIWLYGLALMAVSPFAILFSRKIWAQDVLPLFTLIILLGYMHRRSLVWAFIWGAAGALIGQLHMSGFFFAFGLVLYALWHDKNHGPFQFKSWLAWFVGSVIGSLPLLPWLQYLAANKSGSNYLFWEIFTFKFFTQWWGTAFGINLKEYLGNAFAPGFLPEPRIGEVPTFLVGLAHLPLFALALYTVSVFLYCRFKARHKLPNLAIRSPQLVSLLWATAIVSGIVFTLSGYSVHAHYMIVYYPLPFLWFSLLYADYRKLFKLILICQLFISASFIWYVHRNGGIEGADYGKSYRLQKYKPPRAR